MDTTNKNLLLNTLATTGVIDKIGYIIQGSNLCDGFQTTDWATATTGVLENDSNMDFTNSSGSDIIIVGIALFSSNDASYTGSTIASSEAVKTDLFDSQVTIADGETLRLTSYTYAIE